MTTAYLHLTDTDKPESQTAITASFVDENGKHIGGGGTTEIHTDDTLAGTGTTGNPLKLSDATSQKITKAGTLTADNLLNPAPTEIISGNFKGAQIMLDDSSKLYVLVKAGGGLSVSNDGPWSSVTAPAITALQAISTLAESASLSDVTAKVNEMLNAVKNATAANMANDAITDPGIGEPSIMDSE
jgi:hypothetical protein|nr:MAG TPA: hypothetical protein [Caudoviricetes sp.]